MLLYLTRLDERRCETVITRSDGVTYPVKGVGHMAAIPHDLAHLAIEQASGIRRGLWGSVADGAVFGSLTHVNGHRKPRAAERSKQVRKANKDDLTETEILIRVADTRSRPPEPLVVASGLPTGRVVLWLGSQEYLVSAIRIGRHLALEVPHRPTTRTPFAHAGR